MGNKADITKGRIVKATITEIHDNGYQNISLRGLVTQLDLTTGAFYKAFSDKDELFLFVTEKLSKEIAEDANRSINFKKSDSREILFNIGEFLLKKFAEDANIMEFVFFNPLAINFINEDRPNTEYYSVKKLTMDQIAKCGYQSNTEINDIFIKLWSFIQGYGSLITNQAVAYKPALFKSAFYGLLEAVTNEGTFSGGEK